MCDKELIVAYLYDELPGAERAALDAHVSVCAECRIELEELRSTRMQLAHWAPPEPDLGFRLIRGGAEPAPALPRRNRFVPAFAFAAAAVIVLAAAAAIANIEVRYGSDGMTVRTGWARQTDDVRTAEGAAAPRPAAGLAAVPSADAQATAVAGSQEFAAIDKRLREIESVLATASNAPGVQAASTSRMSDGEILRQVRQIVSEAEARQDTAVARRLLQVFQDLDAQRRADLVLIQQGLGQYQGMTNAEIAHNRDMLNQYIRAATKQEK